MPPAPSNDRRRYRRRKPFGLVYLEFGRENGGMIKDVSEGGIRFHLMNPVAAGQTLHFAVGIDATRRFEGQARMVWTDASGKSGGLCFAELSEPSRETLRVWLAEIDGPEAVSEPAVAPAAAPPVAAPVAAPMVAPPMVAPPIVAPREVAPIPAAPVVAPPVAVAATPTVPVGDGPSFEQTAPEQTAAERVSAWERFSPPMIATTVSSRGPGLPAAASTATPPTLSPPTLSPSMQSGPTPAAMPPAAPPTAPSAATPTATEEKAPEPLQVGSQFISNPAPRDLWKIAAKEEIAPGDRARRPLAARKVKAMRDEVLAANRSASAVDVASRPETNETGTRPGRATLSETAREVAEPVTSPGVRLGVSDENEPAVDPLRDFLRKPIGGGELAEVSAAEASKAFDEAEDFEGSPRRSGWTLTRVALVLALAAVCGVAGAFAGIAYRQNVGETLIRLGEKISGESRPNGNVPPDSPASAPGNAANPEAPAALRGSEKSGAAKSRSAAPQVDAPQATPANHAPISQQLEPSSAVPRAGNPEPAAAVQTQLAAGREVIPGKPRHPPEDVASLWVAVENGDTTAEVALAERYVTGDGVEKSCEQARVLLQAAAKHGNEAATKRLEQLASAGCE